LFAAGIVSMIASYLSDAEGRELQQRDFDKISAWVLQNQALAEDILPS